MTANSVTSKCRTLLLSQVYSSPGDLPAWTFRGESGFLNDTTNLLFPLAPGTGDIDVGSDAIACAFETTRRRNI